MRARTTAMRGVAREIGLVCFAAAVYGGVRVASEGSVEQAVVNAEAVNRLERSLGISWEAAAQSLIFGRETFVTLANWMYIFGHWPVIIAAAAVLYVKRPSHYLLLRNSMIASGLIGFGFFYAMPTAPPRLVSLGLSDTVLERSSAYRTLQPPSLTNQYAAMPSLHFGWNLLVGIVLFAAFTGLAIRAIAVLMPAAMAFAVVATANHFVLDVLVAVVVACVGLAVAIALKRRQAAADGTERVARNPNNQAIRPRLH